MQDAREPLPDFVMLNSFQHPWPGAIQPGRRQFEFRTKTQSHKDVVRTAKRLSFATARPAASLTGMMGLSAEALFFVALCLCANQRSTALKTG